MYLGMNFKMVMNLRKTLLRLMRFSLQTTIQFSIVCREYILASVQLFPAGNCYKLKVLCPKANACEW
jgi:hypothetical protein